jgi:amidase
MADFFSAHDLLLTPTIADFPVAAEGWVGRGIVENVRAARFAAFTGAWNVAGFPAAAIPVTREGCKVPPSVQLVGPPQAESRVLSLAYQLEQERGWQRHPEDPPVGLAAGAR